MKHVRELDNGPSAATSIETSVLVVQDARNCVWHMHDGPELLWHLEGSYRVELEDRSWLVAPGSAVWVPAGTSHRVNSDSGFVAGWAVFPTELCPTMWNQPTAVPVSSLLLNLLSYLGTSLTQAEREPAEAVIVDVLRSFMASGSIELPIPREERCRSVAEGILADPACQWELTDWASEVGVGSRTLARLFQTETSMTFGQWRTQARVKIAIGDLAVGQSIATIARRTGYSTTNAFISAFKRVTGRTPHAYLDGTDGELDLPHHFGKVTTHLAPIRQLVPTNQDV